MAQKDWESQILKLMLLIQLLIIAGAVSKPLENVVVVEIAKKDKNVSLSSVIVPPNGTTFLNKTKISSSLPLKSNGNEALLDSISNQLFNSTSAINLTQSPNLTDVSRKDHGLAASPEKRDLPLPGKSFFANSSSTPTGLEKSTPNSKADSAEGKIKKRSDTSGTVKTLQTKPNETSVEKVELKEKKDSSKNDNATKVELKEKKELNKTSGAEKSLQLKQNVTTAERVELKEKKDSSTSDSAKKTELKEQKELNKTSGAGKALQLKQNETIVEKVELKEKKDTPKSDNVTKVETKEKKESPKISSATDVPVKKTESLISTESLQKNTASAADSKKGTELISTDSLKKNVTSAVEVKKGTELISTDSLKKDSTSTTDAKKATEVLSTDSLKKDATSTTDVKKGTEVLSADSLKKEAGSTIDTKKGPTAEPKVLSADAKALNAAVVPLLQKPTKSASAGTEGEVTSEKENAPSEAQSKKKNSEGQKKSEGDTTLTLLDSQKEKDEKPLLAKEDKKSGKTSGKETSIDDSTSSKKKAGKEGSKDPQSLTKVADKSSVNLNVVEEEPHKNPLSQAKQLGPLIIIGLIGFAVLLLGLLIYAIRDKTKQKKQAKKAAVQEQNYNEKGAHSFSGANDISGPMSVNTTGDTYNQQGYLTSQGSERQYGNNYGKSARDNESGTVYNESEFYDNSRYRARH
ncbi:expressed protein [Phakopsora pachyrhizi]|uniref:Expressed protein n=1 Tax=Phakopsora pachyrhizi TaxID=170000 RepID=A0AAV0BEI2_PHAPC|nr:expressed protein [Phakopsora pachyrhizi]